MKTTFLFLSFILGSSASLFAQKESKNTCANAKAKQFNIKSNTLNLQQIARTEKYDVNFYRLDLNMSNTSTDLAGVVEIHGKAKVILDSVLIELFQDFTINDIKLNDVSVAYNRTLSAIIVPVNLAANQSFKISVDYAGTPPTAATNPLGGAGMTNDFSPSWGNQVTWSLSEPFSAYEWFPCKQSLTDKADSVDVNITIPDNLKAGSNGKLTAITYPSTGMATYHWKHRHPIDYYLISVAIADYNEYNVYANPVGSSPVLIQNYIYDSPGYLDQFQADIEETADFLELFSEKFGLYPFNNEKYGHCIAPLGGGMEHQTMTTQAYFEKGLTAHELAHQWWGNQVTCQSWADIWVNEGFASYAEYIMLENLYPTEKAGDMLSRHNNIMSQPGGSVWVEDSLNAGRIFSGRLTYNKGAAIVHTIRYLVNNDNIFFQGLKNYQNMYKNKTALGVDFQSIMEDVSGVDLTEAFEQWYFGEGYPTYAGKWNMNGNDLHLIVSQTVSAQASTPMFTNPIDVLVTLDNGTDTTLRLPVSSLNNQYIISLPANATGISFDPENWIINQNGPIINETNMNLTGISEYEATDNFSVFPNPIDEKLTVNGTSESYTLNIIDPKGRVILTKQLGKNEEINTKNLESGSYLFQFKSADGKEVRRKIVKK
jgi:aminopeptidase N